MFISKHISTQCTGLNKEFNKLVKMKTLKTRHEIKHMPKEEGGEEYFREP